MHRLLVDNQKLALSATCFNTDKSDDQLIDPVGIVFIKRRQIPYEFDKRNAYCKSFYLSYIIDIMSLLLKVGFN